MAALGRGQRACGLRDHVGHAQHTRRVGAAPRGDPAPPRPAASPSDPPSRLAWMAETEESLGSASTPSNPCVSWQANFTFITVKSAGHMVPQYQPVTLLSTSRHRFTNHRMVRLSC